MNFILFHFVTVYTHESIKSPNISIQTCLFVVDVIHTKKGTLHNKTLKSSSYKQSVSPLLCLPSFKYNHIPFQRYFPRFPHFFDDFMSDLLALIKLYIEENFFTFVRSNRTLRNNGQTYFY